MIRRAVVVVEELGGRKTQAEVVQQATRKY